MIQKLDVVGINSKKANMKFRYPGTFLHGVLETETEYDIFCFTKKTSFELGATKVIIEKTGRRATFFLWEGDRFNQYRGYLVYDNDPEYEYCRINFENQEQCI